MALSPGGKGGRVRVSIEGDPDDLIREIRAAERAVDKFGRSGAAAGAQASAGMTKASMSARALRTAGLGAAHTVSRIGSAAKTAAPYLIGGLALGLGKSVIEAREANKVGKQTEAVIKSTGGAAKVTAKDVSDLAEEISLLTGIDDEAIQTNENLLLTFKNVRNEVGQGNDIFNRATQAVTDMSVAMDQSGKSSSIQLGKALNDPVAGLTSLTRVGVQFTEQQKEQIAAMVESGDMLGAQKVVLKELESQFAGSAEAQADSFDKIQVAAENFAESVGEKVTPVLAEMSDELSAILSDQKLTDSQRLDKVADFFEKWGLKGIEALEDAAPDIARVGARLAGRGAQAFVKAWWESDVWGKLFLAGAFIRAVGGPGVFGKIGGRVGGLIAARMATTVATEGAAGAATAAGTGAAANRWGRMGRVAGRIAGPALGLALATFGAIELWRHREEIIDAVDRIADELPDVLGLTRDDVPSRKEAMAAIRGSEGAARKSLISQFEEMFGEKPQLKAGRSWEAFWRDAERTANRGGKATNRTVEENLRGFNRALQRGTEQGKRSQDELNASSRQMANKTGGSYRDLAGTVAQGLLSIKNNTNKALDAYGVKALDFQLGKPADRPGGPSGFGGRKTAQTGAMIVPGNTTGDSVPVQALVEPNEVLAVLNRNAAAAWMAWNEEFPRFVRGGTLSGDIGGLVPPFVASLRSMSSGTGSPISVTSGLRTRAEQERLYAMYLAGTGNLAAPPGSSHHELGIAADIAPGRERFGGASGKYGMGFTVPSESWHIELLNAAMGKVGGVDVGAVPRIGRPIIKGPAGPLRSMGQASIDQTVRAARKYAALKYGQFSKATGAVGPGGIISGDGDVERVFARTAKRLSRSKTATLALGMAGYAESGMRDLGYGDASSQGALQLLASTAAGLGVSPHDEGAIASLFLNRGFYGRGGANALAAKGLPAHLVAQNVQGSAFSDGSNYLAQAGPAKAWMKRFGLQRGGIARRQGGGGVPALPGFHGLRQDAKQAARRIRRREGRLGSLDDRIADEEDKDVKERLRERRQRARERQRRDEQMQEFLAAQIEQIKDLRSEVSGLRRDVREGARITDRAFEQWLADRLGLALGEKATNESRLASAGVGARF